MLALILILAGGFLAEQRPAVSDIRAAEREIEARLERNDRPELEVWTDLLGFVRRTAATVSDPETRARFVLYELRVSGRALEMARRGGRPDADAFLRELEGVIVEHAPAGQYVFRNDYLLELHDRYRTTAVGDDLAWFMVENGLPGECEGYLPCYAFRFNTLDAEYLRRYPRGKHAAQALQLLAEVFEPNARRRVWEGPKDEICGEMASNLKALIAAVRSAEAPQRDRALDALTTLEATCAAPSQGEGERVIIAADGVRLRTAPSVDATVAQDAWLGRQLLVVRRHGAWLEVQTSEETAFVRGDLVRAITAETVDGVEEAIIRERLARPVGLFEQEDRLLRIIHQTPRSEREAKARFAYYRLEALRRTAKAASKVPLFHGRFVEALAQDSSVLAFNEMYGEWQLRHEHIRKVQEEFKGTAASDDLAWIVVEVGWGGECQDHLACPVLVLDEEVGTYLRSYPAGRHAAAAMDRIATWLDFKGLEPFSSDPALPRAATCTQLAVPLKALTEAVARSSAGNKQRALAPLQQIAAACR